MVTEKTVVMEKRGEIGTLTFNRPEVFNAYNRTVSDELMQGLETLTNDSAVKVIVITGAGKGFMAGADSNMVNGWSAQGDAGKIRQTMGQMFSPNMLEECPKPIIAAVNGLAFGMGCEIAMGCDYRIVAEKAQFALP